MRLKQCPDAIGSFCQHLAVFRRRGRAPTQARLSQVNALSAGCREVTLNRRWSSEPKNASLALCNGFAAELAWRLLAEPEGVWH